MAGRFATSVAQLVEHRSPKPAVGGSIPSARAPRFARGRTARHRVATAVAWGLSRGLVPPSTVAPADGVPLVDRRANAFYQSPHARDASMGKVKDGTPASKPSKPPKGTQVAQSKRRLAPFFANLVRANLYKPKQGRLARRSTEIALGVDPGPRALEAARNPLLLRARRPVRCPVGRRAGARLVRPSGSCSSPRSSSS